MKNNIVKIISILSILVGVVVIIGWILDITILTSIMPYWIRMKTATALCFVFSGVILLSMSFGRAKFRELNTIFLIVFSMLNVLVMGTLFLGSVLGFQTGMENIGFVDVHEVKTPIFQGRPSVATMICFLLIAVVGLLYNYGYSKKSLQIIKTLGFVIFVMGLTGVFGYVLNIPTLFFEISGISNAIAIHTTALFAFLGVGIVLFYFDNENKD